MPSIRFPVGTSIQTLRAQPRLPLDSSLFHSEFVQFVFTSIHGTETNLYMNNHSHIENWELQRCAHARRRSPRKRRQDLPPSNFSSSSAGIVLKRRNESFSAGSGTKCQRNISGISPEWASFRFSAWRFSQAIVQPADVSARTPAEEMPENDEQKQNQFKNNRKCQAQESAFQKGFGVVRERGISGRTLIESKNEWRRNFNFV